MCTPQLRNQAAALQGPANSNYLTGDSTSIAADPLRRQAMALSPIITGQGFARNVPSPPAGANASSIRSQTSLDTLANEGLSVRDRLSNGTYDVAPSNPQLSAGEKPDRYDERHAPTPETLAEVIRHAKVRQPYERRQPARSPFAYSRDYRTSREERAWLSEVERRLGNGRPYPDGTPGPSAFGAGDRARERILAGYLYTLPEGKAFLDVLSTTEGTTKHGYFTMHDGTPPVESLSQFANNGRQGRYQFLSGNNGEIVNGQMGRRDFGEVTQDIAALSLLVRFGAMQKLIHGDLQGAFTAASRAFASLPISQRQDYSGFTQSGTWEGTGKDVPRQHSIPFAQLPALFLDRLNARRAEFREAERNWRSKGQMPWAFISPYRQPFFGRDAFQPSR